MAAFLFILLSVFNTVLIPVQFKDCGFSCTAEQIEQLSLDCTGYLNAQFKESREYSITVAPCVTIDGSISHYGANTAEKIDAHCREVLQKACAATEEYLALSKFDANGDGTIDCVILLVAGPGEDEGAGEQYFWPHYGKLSDEGESFSVAGYGIDDFIVCPEIRGGSFTGAGVLCHEFGHFLGLPDFYDTDGNGSGGSTGEAIGDLSLMDTGYKTADIPGFCAPEREIAGTGHFSTLKEGSYALSALDGCLKLQGSEDGEYFLIEYSGRGPEPTIFYIDKSNRDSGYSSHQGRSITAAERWKLNEVNCNPEHPCARLWKGPFRFSNGEQSGLSITNVRQEDSLLKFDVVEAISIKEFESYQDGAAVRFRANLGKSGIRECKVEWFQNDKLVCTQIPQTMGEDLFALLDKGLDSDRESICRIEVKADDGESFFFEKKFKTQHKWNGTFPFIVVRAADRNSDGTFTKGAIIPLKLGNSASCVNTVWTFDGRDIPSGWFEIKGSGELRAKAELSDGTTEVLSKKITVK